MNETLDNLFAKCQQLPDEDFEVLMSAMTKERKDRAERIQESYWHRVCNAIDEYVERYGSITIEREFMGVHRIRIESINTWAAPELGKIKVD